MGDINVTTSGIINLLQNLDVHKTSGPDEISARLLKETAEVTAPVLKLIFEKSLDTGKVPMIGEWLTWHLFTRRGNDQLLKTTVLSCSRLQLVKS